MSNRVLWVCPVPKFVARLFLGRFSPLGWFIGAVAFTASLTPSLIPRTGLLQGVVAGLAYAVAYGLGAGAGFLWRWLGFPVGASERGQRTVLWLTVLVGLAVMVFGLTRATGWQNAVHRAMGMAEVESARPWIIAGVAFAVALLLLLVWRLFCLLVTLTSALLGTILPPRVALLGGFVGGATFFWSVGNGVLLHAALQVLDGSYQQVDRFIAPDATAPTDPSKTGSPASLIGWAGLGAEGRNRILAAPNEAAIAVLSGGKAKEPLRVYVGLNSAESVEDRARLALAELMRIGGFDRANLIIATPTGTGWIDPAAVAPAEILLRGDVASVSEQYSYLPSWLSLMVESDYGVATARAVFAAIYDHWRTMPKDNRPRLYLFGLSLGALNSDLSADFFDIIGDPYAGALWVGPPYATQTWRQVTNQRVEGSPAWLPIFRDGKLFRFQNQKQSPAAQSASWGPPRIVYLQYASDPIVFYERASLWRRPAWMAGPRGPDVASELSWVPVVTFLQLLCDMMTATTTPAGVGHVYAAEHYLSGWMAVMTPEGWSAERLDGVRRWLARHRQ